MDIPDEDLRLEREAGTDRVIAVWERWHARDDLYISEPQDRHYMVERAGGWFRFGDAALGKIPSAGARIAVSYGSGGGLAGNLEAGVDLQLYAAVPFVTGVVNPVAGGGGSGSERFEAVRDPRPAAITPSRPGIDAG